MRVLGIDPGSRYLGFGLVEWRAGRAVHLGSGVVRADARAPLAERLQQIFVELQQVIRVFKPAAVAVEGVFTHKNARSALILGHARGVALLLAAQAGVPVFEYAPARVKRSVGAGGNDSKGSVARMVQIHLRLDEPLERADAYDALAVALCHVHAARSPLSRRSGSVLKLSTTSREGAASDFYARLKPSVVPARRAVP